MRWLNKSLNLTKYGASSKGAGYSAEEHPGIAEKHGGPGAFPRRSRFRASAGGPITEQNVQMLRYRVDVCVRSSGKKPFPLLSASYLVWRFCLLKSVLALGLFVPFFVATPTRSNNLSSGELPSSLDHRIRLYHTHTGEHIDIVYRHGETFLPEAEEQLDHFMRDHRTGDVKHYDPRLFDILSDIAAAVGRPGAEIEIICGYRSTWSNEFLRARSSGVAKNSLHKQAQAIDIRINGVSTQALRDAALALGRGGVGYYPRSGFVHVDSGRIRTWCYGCTSSSNNSQ